MAHGTDVFALEFERDLRAPRLQVWETLTRGEEIARWFGPSDDFRIEVLEWDCQPGGSYRVAMHAPDGSTHTCFGTFREVDAPTRLSYSWSWEGQPPMDTLVAFELDGEGDTTKLRFSHTGFPSVEAKEQHRTGWTGSLDRLARSIS